MSLANFQQALYSENTVRLPFLILCAAWYEQSGCPPYSIVDVYHTSISCFPIPDNTVSVIAGGAGAGGLLLVVTAVILFCMLIMRKVHSTTQSKLYVIQIQWSV